jgi:hypothetical protein
MQERVFLMASGFHLQKSAITLRSNIIEMMVYFDMASIRTDGGTSVNSVVIRTTDGEKLSNIVCKFGRQHNNTTIYSAESEVYFCG